MNKPTPGMMDAANDLYERTFTSFSREIFAQKILTYVGPELDALRADVEKYKDELDRLRKSNKKMRDMLVALRKTAHATLDQLDSKMSAFIDAALNPQPNETREG